MVGRDELCCFEAGGDRMSDLNECWNESGSQSVSQAAEGCETQKVNRGGKKNKSLGREEKRWSGGGVVLL